MNWRFAGVAIAAAAGLLLSEASDVQARPGGKDPSRPIINYPDEEAAAAPAEPTGEQAASGQQAAETAGSADAQTEGSAAGDQEALIAQHATEAGIPVELARAIVRIESNFNPQARGSAGEVGLMQIKPQTARGIGFQGNADALYDPDTNLRWGMKYLGGAYRLAGGDICGTIMRYQGGHRATRMTGANRTYCSRVKSFMGEGA